MDWSPPSPTSLSSPESSMSVEDAAATDNPANPDLASSHDNNLIDIYYSHHQQHHQQQQHNSYQHYHQHLQREHIDPHLTEHIADLCIQKLQHPSSGRQNSLLRQVQLTCMLHRIRMQAFLRPVMAGYHHHYHQQQQQQLLLQQQQQQHQQQEHQQQLQLQFQQEQQHLQEQQAFDQEMSSHPDYDQQQELQQQPMGNAASAYEWSQEPSSSSLGSNQLASALSLDMLLSLGSPLTSSSSPLTSMSSGSVVGSSMTPIPDPTMFDFYASQQQQQLLQQQQQQQHLHSLSLSSIPLVSLAEEYSTSIPSATPASSPLVLSTQQQQPLVNASHLPQQTYYELLMAASPNEPLSQLLSTSAATMTSTCFTATPSSSIPTSVALSSSSALPVDHSSAYTALDAVSAVSSSPIPSTASGSMTTVEAPSAEQILSSVASAYSMSPFPLGPSIDGQQQQQQQHHNHQQQQQTVPLTTKEIMDALSGQFPIQPVMTATVTEAVSPTVASIVLSATAATSDATTTVTSTAPDNHNASDATEECVEATVSSAPLSLDDKDTASTHRTETVAPSAAVESGTASEWMPVVAAVIAPLSEGPAVSNAGINIRLRQEQQQQQQQHQEESWESDVDVLSPPSLVYAQDTDDESSGPTASLSSVTSPSAHMDLEMSEMTLTSPPLSPSRGPRMLRRSKSLAAGGLAGQSNDGNNATSQRRKSRRISRRYQALSESSSFGARLDTSIESETLDSEYEEHYQQDEQQQQQVTTMSPKRRRPSDDDASESPCSSPESSPPSPRTPPPSSTLPSLATTNDVELNHHGGIVVGYTIDHELDPSKRLKVKEVQADAGAQGEDAGVLSPLLLTRSPKRQSSRLLRRTSGRLQQPGHAAAATTTTTTTTGGSCAANAVGHPLSSGHTHPSSTPRGKVSAA
ncbi:hypothetical protein BGX29_002259 [Mortierella sp. GBA35]|nr:hypothetical protein BGX29_002259 [Mortierella sp. GBA35]